MLTESKKTSSSLCSIVLLLGIFALLIQPSSSLAQRKMTPKEYTNMYKDDAVEKMALFGIPASITLAQGMLESGYGGSELSIKANNHFGIKCGKHWNGAKSYHDDDAQNECFRKYRTVGESYRDHSKFLTGNKRYASLFKLDILDYKGWAHGLKAAGYATNPKYANLLINLIERNSLHHYDIPQNLGGIIGSSIFVGEGDAPKPDRKAGRTWGRSNGVKYIVARTGDNWNSLSREYNIRLTRLLRFNDLPVTIPIKSGERIYLKAKKCRNKFTNLHTVQPGENKRSIAQRYGIKLSALERMNRDMRQSEPKLGNIIRLK